MKAKAKARRVSGNVPCSVPGCPYVAGACPFHGQKTRTVTEKRWGYLWPCRLQPPPLLSYSMWRTRRKAETAMGTRKGVIRLTVTYEAPQ